MSAATLFALNSFECVGSTFFSCSRFLSVKLIALYILDGFDLVNKVTILGDGPEGRGSMDGVCS